MLEWKRSLICVVEGGQGRVLNCLLLTVLPKSEGQFFSKKAHCKKLLHLFGSLYLCVYRNIITHYVPVL